MKTRTSKKLLPAAVILLFLAAIAFYGIFIEPNTLATERIIIKEGKLAATLAGKKAVFLSDLHFGSSSSRRMQRILDAINTETPDFIFLTGDFVAWASGYEAYENAFKFLAKLKAPDGVFGVLGDSDFSFTRQSCRFCHKGEEWDGGAERPVTFFLNSGVIRHAAKGSYFLAGIANIHSYGNNPLDLISSFQPMPGIILSHRSAEPYSLLDPSQSVLLLAGDTHGGQVFLPQWLWRLLPGEKTKRLHGFYHKGKASLIVSNGVGTSRLPLRIGVPPEILVLEFQP